MINQRENSSFLIQPKSITPNPNDDKIESPMPSLEKKNEVKCEENHESKSTSDARSKFNDAGTVLEKPVQVRSIVEEHVSGHIKEKSTSDERSKFNDAVAVLEKPVQVRLVVEEHASGHIKGESYMEDNGRERLKRHRVEVAGHVWIPDIWGQEELLKDWIDCSAFDASLMNSNITSARAALVEERRRANSSCRLRIENSC